MVMNKRYYILTAVISYLFFVIATLPASLAKNLIEKNTAVSIQGISGTLWQGKIQTLQINRSITLTNTSWTLTVWKLITGRAEADINSNFDGDEINTKIGSSFLGKIFIDDLSATLQASNVARLANIPLVQLSGKIDIDIEHADWQQGYPPTAKGELNWNNATLTVAETVSLGNIKVILGDSEEQQLVAEIKNNKGDILIEGDAKVIPETDYALNIKLSPTATASDNTKRSLALFSKKQPNGDFLLNRTGSLNQIGLM